MQKRVDSTIEVNKAIAVGDFTGLGGSLQVQLTHHLCFYKEKLSFFFFSRRLGCINKAFCPLISLVFISHL